VLGCDEGRQGTGLNTGLIMISEYHQLDKIADHYDQPGLNPIADLPPLTPETARRLAAILAPHLVAMRAVTAGTRYAESGDNAGDDTLSARSAPPMSPATAIFIAGMLQRIPA
jgi:hypothetical protein